VPVWLALSTRVDWRWLLDRDDSPWYAGLRLFRQPLPGDWRSVFEDMARALRRVVAAGEQLSRFPPSAHLVPVDEPKVLEGRRHSADDRNGH
jgi:hypothetical protein